MHHICNFMSSWCYAGVTKAALSCAHRTRAFSGRALREQGKLPVAPAF